ncbi:MAG: 5-deoxy-glucuronate isomerase [Chloroflexota bacterium]|nr:5-deoxy-glucuronate isomerase [Chloroflexota bacterium]
MTLQYHFRKDIVEGYTPLVSPEEEGLEYLEVGILKLPAGASYSTTAEDSETALVILSGRATVEAGGERWGGLGGREDVFQGPGDSVYVPLDASYTVTAETDLEVGVCKALTDFRGEPRLVRSDEGDTAWRGRRNFERHIRNVMLDNVQAGRLLVGETINPPGNWSSFPPHKHDEVIPGVETKLEEVYLYKITPQQGFGIQRLYTAEGDMDEAFVLQNNDAVIFPRGYHPVVAAPGYKLYYLWALAGEERRMQPHDDPQHEWVSNAW